MTRQRRNVWDLVADANDRTLEWYARGVAAMKRRPISDHRSWRFQAAIHDYSPAEDPLASPTDQLPAQADQDRFWRQCQHNSWFFLPWHRMYLHHFEQIVRAEILAVGGPADWALPYWNYSRDEASRTLPTPFRGPTLPGGAPNPLYVEARSAASNHGDEFADEFDVAVTECLRAPTFANPQFAGTPGFGGPATGFSHGGGDVGLLERVPHGSMHVAVGGAGWMSAFNTAALDPIFWLHHANIDRLWDVWLRRDVAHTNPTSNFWQASVRFQFRNVDGAVVAMRCAEVLDTMAAPLDYGYDDVGDPLTPQTEATGLAGAEEKMAQEGIPEMVGATHAPFELGETIRHATIPTGTAAASMLESAGGTEEAKRRMYLHIEHLTSDSRAPSYDVYLGLPTGAEPSAHPDKRVARLAMFGLPESSRKDGPMAGSGLTFALEVTELVQRLRGEGNWNPDELAVSFVPVRDASGARVRVGRMSLYVE